MTGYFFYRIGEIIALSLPLKAAYSVAVFFSDVHYIFAFRDRQSVLANLKLVFPEKSVRQVKGIRIHIFRNFAKYLVDFFRFKEVNTEYIHRYVKVENASFVTRVLSKGKGCILVTAHIGNWELGGAIIAMLGYPLWAVALPHKSRKVDRFFNQRRESKGVHVMPLGKALRKSFSVLRENKVLALLGDRIFGMENGVPVNFFGKRVVLPKGPAVLSLATGASIVPVFMIRNPDDTFTLHFEEPIEPGVTLPEKNENDLEMLRLKHVSSDRIDELTDKFKCVIERYIRKYPEQWYMFPVFWNEAK